MKYFEIYKRGRTYNCINIFLCVRFCSDRAKYDNTKFSFNFNFFSDEALVSHSPFIDFIHIHLYTI